MPSADPDREHGHTEPLPPTGLIPNAAERAERERAEEENRKRKEHQLLLDLQQRQTDAQIVQAKSNQAIAGLTAALVIVTVVSGFVSYLQFQAAKTSADAAQNAVRIARDSLGESKETRVQSERDRRISETESKRLADLSRQSSEKQSRDSLKANIDNSRLDQRAWIGVDIVRTEPVTIEVDKRVAIIVSFKNTGKTPAKKMETTTIMDPVPSGRWPDFSYRGEKIARFGLLPPNANNFIRLEVSRSRTGEPRPMIKPMLDSLVSDQFRVYIHGQLTYEDIFGQAHWMTFCNFMINLPGPVGFGACIQHNDTGEGKNPPDDSTLKLGPVTP